MRSFWTVAFVLFLLSFLVWFAITHWKQGDSAGMLGLRAPTVSLQPLG